MSTPPLNFRKRNRPVQKAANSFSTSLRACRDLIADGKHEDALTALNQLAGHTRNPNRRGKILLLTAESEAALSRHPAAAAAYARSRAFAKQAENPNLLLSAASGEIRSLLLAMRTPEAKTAAATLLAEFATAQQAHDKIASLSPAQLAARGSVHVPPQPPRATVVLTKIATSFIQAGLTEDARIFLNKAIQLAPNGASRARQSLAKLALAADEPAIAERYARESILMGRFQAKTIAAWQLYLDARARQNLSPILEADVFAALNLHAKGRIASASLHSIARTLRTHGDSTWKQLAQAAISSKSKDPIISTEFEKLLQADAKLTASENPRGIAARALRLFRESNVSAQEQVAHGKAYVRFSLLAKATPHLALIARVATARHGLAHSHAVRHAMALGAEQARDYAAANQMFLDLLKDLEPGTAAWGKANWALARMCEGLEKHGEASVWYFQLAENPVTPSRFRIQAMLKGFRQLVKSGSAVDPSKISASVSTILESVDDYKIALDAARQLALTRGEFLELKLKAAQRGKILAIAAIKDAQSAREKLTILEYLARRQFYDLGDYSSILQQWDQLTASDRLQFEALSGSLWYEYVAVIFRALQQKKRDKDAESLVAGIIDRDRTTPEGYVIVGTEYAEWLLHHNQKTKAFEYFEWIAKESPTHRRAAVAHYWLALRHLKQGKLQEAKIAAANVRECYGGVPSLLSEYKLYVRSLFILGSDKNNMYYNSQCSENFILEQQSYYESDLLLL